MNDEILSKLRKISDWSVKHVVQGFPIPDIKLDVNGLNLTAISKDKRFFMAVDGAELLFCNVVPNAVGELIFSGARTPNHYYLTQPQDSYIWVNTGGQEIDLETETITYIRGMVEYTRELENR